MGGDEAVGFLGGCDGFQDVWKWVEVDLFGCGQFLDTLSKQSMKDRELLSLVYISGPVKDAFLHGVF